MFNKVILAGRLVSDPKTRKSVKGNNVILLRIAVSTPAGKDTETLFINVVCFGNIADKCKTYLKKGSPVLVEGRLRSRQWISDSGDKLSIYEVIAGSVKFLPDGRRDFPEKEYTTDTDTEPEDSINQEEDSLLEPF